MGAAVSEDPRLLLELNAMPAEDILAWAWEKYEERAGIITSFQDTGCVMIDMAHRVAPKLRVMTIDTLRLHSETYALLKEIEDRYTIEIERFTPDPNRLHKMIAQHGPYLFFDSKAKQEYCCQIRKVHPNIEALRTVDVWFTGLRRDHSEARSNVEKVSIVRQEWGDILKISPLADWDKAQVRRYLEQHRVPYNALYDKGYTSIGCVVCSTPTLPWEDARAGRWRWFNSMNDQDKECGIHTQGGGI